MTNPEEDLQNQIANLDELIKNEDETARLNATAHKDVATQALKRKKILQTQKDQLIASMANLKKYSDLQLQESEKEDKEIEDAIKSANETKTLTDPVLKNELKKQREIIDLSKSGDETPNDNEGSFWTPTTVGLVIAGVGVLVLSIVLQIRKTS